ncbi:MULTISPECIES: sugar ABC transporter substrate-binding protein [Cryobacterium]|uniref:sugar ABC transporter substrate-binding protein n=1 Tax=Cryobacterium TaxID=69578 RepID=UPI000CD3E135|nr:MULTISPECIES: maltose ABC transporter substrate-binding protein [Cryobacterium]POH64515.1 maltose ABC transporter substrate-binding protein [Cryobacterium zongtaii]TFC47439.1 maltose ABC transporter substrate-binding protein [Cryobacterium sp. TMN-39-2]TFC93074.1 maltose ABC transporter substrate-binding protein [Cryobacterium sp. TMT4-31]
MKLTRKARTAGVAIVSLGALVLSGCSASGGEGSTEAGGSGKPITVWVDVERKPALEEPAASFTKETGIEVELVTKDFSTVDQDFISQVPTGKGPDIIVSPHDKLGAYVAAGVVAPIELGDVADGFAETAIQAMTYDGAVYGVPYSIENVGLLRNADLVAEPVATFDDLIAAGRAAGTEYPFLVGLSPEQGDPYHLYPLQTSFGSQVFARNADGTYDPSKLVLGDENGVRFAEALQKWSADGVININIDGDRAREFFIDGKSPFYLTGPWNVPTIKEAGINYVVDPIPSAGGGESQPFVGVNGFFLSSKSTNALAATNFIVNYLSTEDAQLALFEVGGRPPALTSAYDTVAAKDPDVAAFGEIGKTGLPMPSIPEMGSVWSDWGNAELTLIRGEGNPAEVWTKAAENIQAQIGG